MKSFLVLAFFLLAGAAKPSCQPNNSQPVQQLTASNQRATAPGNMMDHAVVIGQRPAGDHAVIIGQRPTGDAGSGAIEHLAPLILMVIAFLITIISGAVIWERKFGKTPWATVVLASIAVIVVLLLLAGVNAYIADQHHGGVSALTHSHHWPEIVLSFIAVVALVLSFPNWNGWKLVFTAAAGLCEAIVIVILLNICPNYAYKLCDGECVMLGSQAGTTFDLPCGDNVAFMALHYPTNITPRAYYERFTSEEQLPHFFDYSTAFPMHDPLYPRVISRDRNLQSEDIKFSLEERLVNPVATCSLFVEPRSFTKAELQRNNVSFPGITDPNKLVAVWQRQGDVLKKIFPGTPVEVENIGHQMSVAATQNKVTYVSYKFAFTYTNPPGEVATPAEDVEVSFVLQDYYLSFPDHPVPVYVQGDMRDLMDLIFIPAQSDAINDPLPAEFFPDFRNSCRSIIKDAIFQEPSIRYWRKHFNFWINPAAGRALDARCGDCSHIQPENMDIIPNQIEFRVLLHRDIQWDFTDKNKLFSAEMNLINDHSEKSSFLHELGHAAFGLSDEYPGGYNYQAVEHLPNTWDKRKDAGANAVLRHKKQTDVVRLY
jgi:hypothetical protein